MGRYFPSATAKKMQVSLKDCKALKIESWSTLVNVACNPPKKKKLLVGGNRKKYQKTNYNCFGCFNHPKQALKKKQVSEEKLLDSFFEILILDSTNIVREISPTRLLFRTLVGDISHKLSSFGVKSTWKNFGRFMRTFASKTHTCERSIRENHWGIVCDDSFVFLGDICQEILEVTICGRSIQGFFRETFLQMCLQENDGPYPKNISAYFKDICHNMFLNNAFYSRRRCLFLLHISHKSFVVFLEYVQQDLSEVLCERSLPTLRK